MQSSSGQYCYEIIIEGILDPVWLDWFGGMEFHTKHPDQTYITGILPDQSALRAVIDRIFDLNLKLISVRRL